MHNCLDNKHIDDHIRRSKVERARQLVFEEGIPSSSVRVNRVLDKFSGIPTPIGPNA